MLLSANLKIRGISDGAYNAIMELLAEEAKDVRAEVWRTNEPADFVPRDSLNIARGRR